LGSGVTLQGDEVMRVSAWVGELARRVDIAGHGDASGSGASSVDSALNAAEGWRRGATSIVVADIARWGADLGGAAGVLAAVDDAQAAAARHNAFTAGRRNRVV